MMSNLGTPMYPRFEQQSLDMGLGMNISAKRADLPEYGAGVEPPNEIADTNQI